jgi:hypothetical protein
MPTDYVLFIHGVNTRSDDIRSTTYADDLINRISHVTPIRPLVVYWGDVGVEEEKKLRDGYQASDTWKRLWFRALREQQLLAFVGDTALYLSRYIGAQVAERVAEQVAKLKDCTAEDRLHLVTHSLGTVILFDLLFSSRWGDSNNDVMAIRDAIYGVTGTGHDPRQGIRLGSITTMGSPISIFSLMDVSPPQRDVHSDPRKATSTHDITPGLVQLLEHLHQDLGKKTLPWSNFIHPGDPLASPLRKIVADMVDEDGVYINVRDEVIPLARVFKESPRSVLLDRIGWLFRRVPVSVLDSGNAHTSYWRSPRVVEGIIQLIQQAKSSDSTAGIESDHASAPSS